MHLNLSRWFINCELSGSVSAFADLAMKEGPMGLWNLWPTPSAEAWAVLAAFGGAEAFLQLYLPGKTFYGPISPKGNIPVYKVGRNGCPYLSSLPFDRTPHLTVTDVEAGTKGRSVDHGISTGCIHNSHPGHL